MFGKKCKRCNERINGKFKFCPFCGIPTKQYKEEDYGMLGQDDELEEFENLFNKMNNPMLNKMLGGVMKMLEKEMGNIGNMNNTPNIPEKSMTGPKTNFQLYVNGKKIDWAQPEIETQNTDPLKTPEKSKLKLPMPSKETIKSSAELPRQEAKTSLKRLANKIIYEIDAPGITSLNKVLINKLEDGFEVRLFTKKAVLSKNISVKLPLINYYLEEYKLFLEFQNK